MNWSVAGLRKVTNPAVTSRYCSTAILKRKEKPISTWARPSTRPIIAGWPGVAMTMAMNCTQYACAILVLGPTAPMKSRTPMAPSCGRAIHAPFSIPGWTRIFAPPRSICTRSAPIRRATVWCSRKGIRPGSCGCAPRVHAATPSSRSAITTARNAGWSIWPVPPTSGKSCRDGRGCATMSNRETTASTCAPTPMAPLISSCFPRLSTP